MNRYSFCTHAAKKSNFYCKKIQKTLYSLCIDVFIFIIIYLEKKDDNRKRRIIGGFFLKAEYNKLRYKLLLL